LHHSLLIHIPEALDKIPKKFVCLIRVFLDFLNKRELRPLTVIFVQNCQLVLHHIQT